MLGINPVVKIFGTDYPTRDGTAVRDYIHTDDLAAAHVLALDRARLGEHAIFNLGNGTGFSVREVIEAAERVTGARIPAEDAPRRPGDPPILVAASRLVIRSGPSTAVLSLGESEDVPRPDEQPAAASP